MSDAVASSGEAGHHALKPFGVVQRWIQRLSDELPNLQTAFSVKRRRASPHPKTQHKVCDQVVS